MTAQHPHSAHQQYRAPRQCPVCSEQLQVTQLGCEACGTGISGEFAQCDFCALDAADLDVLRVFLISRGNMKDLERHLGVSYPTARARFDDLVRKLGLTPSPDRQPNPDIQPGPDIHPGPDPRLATLTALANGELDVDQARELMNPG